MSKQQESKKVHVVTFSVQVHGLKPEPAESVKTDWLSMTIVSAVLNALLLAVLFITRLVTL